MPAPTLTAPARPPAADPDDKHTEPELPAADSPLDTHTQPLRPSAPSTEAEPS